MTRVYYKCFPRFPELEIRGRYYEVGEGSGSGDFNVDVPEKENTPMDVDQQKNVKGKSQMDVEDENLPKHTTSKPMQGSNDGD